MLFNDLRIIFVDDPIERVFSSSRKLQHIGPGIRRQRLFPCFRQSKLGKVILWTWAIESERRDQWSFEQWSTKHFFRNLRDRSLPAFTLRVVVNSRYYDPAVWSAIRFLCGLMKRHKGLLAASGLWRSFDC